MKHVEVGLDVKPLRNSRHRRCQLAGGAVGIDHHLLAALSVGHANEERVGAGKAAREPDKEDHQEEGSVHHLVEFYTENDKRALFSWCSEAVGRLGATTRFPSGSHQTILLDHVDAAVRPPTTHRPRARRRCPTHAHRERTVKRKQKLVPLWIFLPSPSPSTWLIGRRGPELFPPRAVSLSFLSSTCEPRGACELPYFRQPVLAAQPHDGAGALPAAPDDPLVGLWAKTFCCRSRPSILAGSGRT